MIPSGWPQGLIHDPVCEERAKLNRTLKAWFAIFLLIAASAVGCNKQFISHGSSGSVEVLDEQIKNPWPIARPTVIYVSDFALDVEHLQTEQGIGGILPGRRLKRFVENLPHPTVNADPEQRAEKIVTEMNQSLIDSLMRKGFAAQGLTNLRSTALPVNGWLLQGVFTEVDEGNRLKRAVIGFGQGATKMDVQIGISDLTSANPLEPFIVFGTVKDPKKIPGAIVTMNPYVAAAKFVLAGC
ncbi:DUF4410 domain-containing protein [Methylomonas sp. MgM2]